MYATCLFFVWDIEITFSFFYRMPYSYFTSFPSVTTFIFHLTPSFALKRKTKDKRDKLRSFVFVGSSSHELDDRFSSTGTADNDYHRRREQHRDKEKRGVWESAKSRSQKPSKLLKRLVPL